jgi:hypothetical protein
MSEEELPDCLICLFFEGFFTSLVRQARRAYFYLSDFEHASVELSCSIVRSSPTTGI